jgi:choline kinase
VLFRIYGEHVSSFYNPEHELRVFAMLSSLQIGPKMIANGESWRIEEFHESVVVPVASLPNPSIFCQVASQFARLHKIHKLPQFPADQFEPGKPVAFDRLDKWTREGLAALQRLPHADALMERLRMTEMVSEVERLKALIASRMAETDAVGFDVVFCHNDGQENNILLTPYGLRLIDFEYADFNFQVADIGNFFNEFTMDYLHPEPPFFTGEPAKYPSELARRMFASVYLSEYLGRPVMDPTDAALIDNLLASAEIGAQLSHMLWGMWALVRAQQNAETFNSFDFVAYAKFRFDEYSRRKSELGL